MTVTPDSVLDFWFGGTLNDAGALKEKNRLWFQKSFATDRAIADRFVTVLADLAAGQAEEWARKGARQRLAAIIVLDQFSRNIFRGHRFSFTHDPLALSLTMSGLAFNEDQHLTEVERVFFYLPLEHSESLKDQEMSVQQFEKLAREARPAFREFCEMTLDYARKHMEVIERFGRFPHRNAVLRRPSTRDEQAYLSQPGAGF